MSETNEQFVVMSARIVAAYVEHNNVPPGDLSRLIASTYAALRGLGEEPAATPSAPLVPAISIKKSVTPHAIICLEDGKAFKSMKRHLGLLGMTPAEYRTKWGLPADYPMVAPAYAEARSALAKSMGLGRKAAQPAAKMKRATKAKISA